MKALLLSLGLLSLPLAAEAQTPKARTTQLQQDFALKQHSFPRGGFFDIFQQQLQPAERSALEFLYAYMPSSDLMNRSGYYYLANVRTTLRARQELPWGKAIPEREWRHFVLPLRVNNEALDDFRTARYAELRDRVRGLSLREAILEVNHWCHEHVTYNPSDARTSSPLCTLASATGRCGEESTLLVAALRTIGIPARQVYTPRWAHTDDNHAWVEAWVDGRWHFLGACEPEPVLDLAWFNAPVSRAMLVHTKAFGRYDGPEPVISRTPTYTEINVIEGYAHAATCLVEVRDTKGRPVPHAEVEFKLYNYGELYTVARQRCDAQGRTRFTSGQGDLIAYASQPKGSSYVYGLKQVRFGQDKSVRLVLDHQAGERLQLDLKLTPPSEAARYPEVSAEARQRNTQRFAWEDSLRTRYIDSLRAEQVFGLDARANAGVLRQFVEESPDKAKARALLSVLSAKDLRDVPLAMLRDHLQHSQPQPSIAADSALCMHYVYNPRFAHEALTPYKAALRQALPSELRQQFDRSPEAIVAWCRKEISLDKDFNPLGYPTEPLQVWRSRRADSHSRTLLCLSLLRSCGWAARLEPVTGKAQYYHKGQWQDFTLEEAAAPSSVSPQGTLRLAYQDNGILDNPKYYYHFTLSRFDRSGHLHLLSYDKDANGLEQGSAWRPTFERGTKLDAGQYLLVSGSRLADGSVLAQLRSLDIKAGQEHSDSLVMRRDSTAIAVLGNFSSESRYRPLSLGEDKKLSPAGEERSLLSSTGRGYYVLCLMDAGSEPTKHALRDLIGEAPALEQLGRPIALLFPDSTAAAGYRPEDRAGLPQQTFFGLDTEGLAKQLTERFKLRAGLYPIIVVADTFDRVVFVSQGYTIGLGRQLRETLTRLTQVSSACERGGCTKD